MKKKSGEEEEDFASLLEDHLQKYPPSSKTEEPKLLHRNKATHKKSSELTTIDLHGMNLNDAKFRIREIWQQLQSEGNKRQILRVITGKGIHSGIGGPVLLEEIHGFCVRLFGRAIVKIDEDPARVKLSGVPLRGHFDVELQIK